LEFPFSSDSSFSVSLWDLSATSCLFEIFHSGIIFGLSCRPPHFSSSFNSQKGTGSSSLSRKDLDDLVSGLVGESSPQQLEEIDEAEAPQVEMKEARESPKPTSAHAETRNAEAQTLSFAITTTNDYVPRKAECYDKDVQTDDVEELDDEDQTTSTDNVKPKAAEKEALKEAVPVPEKAPEQKPFGESPSVAPNSRVPPLTPALILNVELTQEQKEFLYQSDSFARFIDSSSKVMERALNENFDFLVDYSKDVEAG